MRIHNVFYALLLIKNFIDSLLDQKYLQSLLIKTKEEKA
jgi:hypothetical protein